MKSCNLIRLSILFAFGGTTLSVQATPVSTASLLGGAVSALITAGAPSDVPTGRADSPTNREDANVPSSPFNGVVSIRIDKLNQAGTSKSFICSGAAISPWHVVSAGHCIDNSDGTGHKVDISKPGQAVTVNVNTNNPSQLYANALKIKANKIDIHPDYQGFGHCPTGVSGFCVNDDISIIRLEEALPVDTRIFKIFDKPVPKGAIFTMVGYGTSGEGWNGYNVDPRYGVKRTGKNVYELNDTNDEAGFDPASEPEVWYADFDGIDAAGQKQDAFCALAGVCGDSLGNQVETNIGGGDSGGPSFIFVDGEWQIIANNTFGAHDDANPWAKGAFGDYFGGILLYSYRSWIKAIAVPEPATLPLLGLGFVGLWLSRRRRMG